jgi:hypothetical protein
MWGMGRSQIQDWAGLGMDCAISSQTRYQTSPSLIAIIPLSYHMTMWYDSGMMALGKTRMRGEVDLGRDAMHCWEIPRLVGKIIRRTAGFCSAV